MRSLPSGVVVALCGDHELSTKPQLLDALSRVRKEQRVVIDLQRCTFVDSTIIGAISQPSRASGSEEPNLSVVLPADTSYVYRALSVIGLSGVVPAYLSVEAALGVTSDGGRLERRHPRPAAGQRSSCGARSATPMVARLSTRGSADHGWRAASADLARLGDDLPTAIGLPPSTSPRRGNFGWR